MMKTYLTSIVLALVIGCAGNAAYKTLYSVGHATDVAVKSYLDLVVAGKVPTNNVHKVMVAYNQFQAAYNGAITVAQFNSKTAPDTNTVAYSSAVLTAISAASKGGTQ